jgi:hypothetical protein
VRERERERERLWWAEDITGKEKTEHTNKTLVEKIQKT